MALILKQRWLKLYLYRPFNWFNCCCYISIAFQKNGDVTTDNILNRFKEKGFAKGANREIIKQCESLLDISLNEFVDLVLQGMKSIADDLGL